VRRDEAEAECRRLAAEHPARATHHWLPKADGDGGWVVVRAPMPAGTRVDPLRTAIETKPKPPQADDPRSAFERDTGGYAGGG
jgi:hypothetical protein